MTASGEYRRAEQRVGTTLRDKYRLDAVIGVGGMAAVYAATHRNRRQFAVKILHADLSGLDELRSRFQREGYVANTVGHDGTVAVLDDDVAEDGSAFLVMELLEGAGLDLVAANNGGRLPVPEALCITHQLLDVLAAAHEKNVVHRDIKPANLFLERTGQLKVLDFGIARIREATQSHLATGTGTTLGTPAFMAPEQALGTTSEVDARTDLWAVGATLFTLVSGVLVHEGETAAQILVQVATRAARSLSSVAAQTPPEVVALVARALAFSREERFASAREMQIEVERVHLALYGVPPSRALLLPLAAGGPVLSAAATELSTPPRSGARSAPPVSAPRSLPPPSMTASVGMPLPSIDSALGRKALASGSSMAGTANPVAVHPSAAMAEPGRRTTRAFAGLVVVGFLAGAAWWWWWRPGMSAEDHTALAASGSPATQPVSTVAALPTAAVTATPEVSASAGLAAPPNVIPAASSPPSDNKGGPSHLHVHGGASQASPGSQFSPSGDKQHPLVPEPSSAEPRNPLDMQIH